jgi:hypothetical protein
MNLIDNLLSRLGYSRQTLIKQYFNRRNFLLGQKGAMYLDVEAPYELYNTIPELRTTIDKIATMTSNMVIKYRNKNTGEIIDLPEDLNRLIQNPNVMQSMNDWIFNYISQKLVYGNQFMYKNKPTRLSKYPASLINISPRYIKPFLSGKYMMQMDIKDIVLYYEYTENSKVQKIETDLILWTKIEDLDNPLNGTSPIKSLKYPLSNTKLAYDYLNSISGEKGAIGMLSGDNKDGMGTIPLTPEQRRDIEEQHRRDYGVDESQGKILMPEIPMKWTPFSYPTKDLLLLEQISANFKTILDIFGVNPNIFINSTYENLKHGLVMTYQDTIFTHADAFTQSLTKFLMIEPGFELVADYSHVAILKTDEKEETANLKTKIDAIVQLRNSNIITSVQAAEILNQLTMVDIPKIDNTVSEKINLFSPLVSTKVLETMTTNERRDLAGLPSVQNGDTIPTQQVNNGGF